MDTFVQLNPFELPWLFEQAAREIGYKHGLSDEQREFLVEFVSSVARVVFGGSDDSELRGMKSRESELASLDGRGAFEKALSELKNFMLTSSTPAATGK